MPTAVKLMVLTVRATPESDRRSQRYRFMLEIDARLTFEPDPHPFSHKVPYVSSVFGGYILLVNRPMLLIDVMPQNP